MPKPPPRPGQTPPRPLFTVDNENTNPIQMPSITKLLNRKKLGFSESYKTQFTLLRQQPPGFNPTQMGDQLRVQKVAPRDKSRKKPKLMHWERTSLKNCEDAFQKGVSYLIEKGARQILLMMPGSPVSDFKSDAPFLATCAYEPGKQEEIWRGLALSSQSIPDSWEKLFNQGCIEIAPTRVNQSEATVSTETFLRKAFGLGREDWLMLIRCGSRQACTGLLAIISNGSMAREVIEAFSAPTGSIDSAPKKTAA